MVREVYAGTRRGIAFERVEQSLRSAVKEFHEIWGEPPAVIMVAIPIIREAEPDVSDISNICGIPVAVCPSMKGIKILVADAQTYCDVKQHEKEQGYLNEH